MLAPLPAPPDPGLAPLTRSMPLPPGPVRINPCIVAGEEAPAWLAAAFAVAGALIATMSAALWQQGAASPSPTALAVTQLAAPPRRETVPAERPVWPQQAPSPEPALITPAAPLPLIAPIKIEPPALPAAPAAAPIAPPETTVRGTVAASCFAPLTIAFERGSAQPNPADMKRSLAVLRPWLSQHREATVLIDGHTDASGSEDLNVLLSYSRAKAIAARLKRENIPAGRIAVRAAGAGEARGETKEPAGDRSAILRIAGVEACDQRTTAKRP